MEKSPGEPYRFSIETEAGVKSATFTEVEGKSKYSGDGKPRICVEVKEQSSDSGKRLGIDANVKEESSYSGDRKSRTSIEVKEKSLDSGHGRSRMRITITTNSPGSGDGKLRIGFKIALDVNDGKPRICVEGKDKSSDSGKCSGIDLQVKEESSDSRDGKSGIEIEVKERNSNTSSEECEPSAASKCAGWNLFWTGILIWLALGIITRVAIVRPNDGDVAFSYPLKAQLKTEKKLDKLKFQEFWRECQQGIEWREWKRYIGLQTWLDARWEAYDRGIDVDDVLCQWLNMEINTVPPLRPSTEVTTIERRRWAMQRDIDTMRDVAAKIERDEAAMRRQREQQKMGECQNGPNTDAVGTSSKGDTAGWFWSRK